MDVSGLPFIDEHSGAVGAQPAETWEAVRGFAGRLARGNAGPLGSVLGTDPASGFAVVEEVEGELVALEGRHRFARYRAEIRVEELGAGSLVRIRTLAEFPGAKGRAYRALVIGTRGHVVAIRWFLRRIRCQATSASEPPSRTARRSAGAAR